MAYVITSSCIGTSARSCRDSDGGFPCVEACPVDGIYGRPGDPQLYINTEECIDCADCFVECPVAAVFVDSDVPEPVRAINTASYHTAVSQPSVA
jgi:ferredoxin